MSVQFFKKFPYPPHTSSPFVVVEDAHLWRNNGVAVRRFSGNWQRELFARGGPSPETETKTIHSSHPGMPGTNHQEPDNKQLKKNSQRKIQLEHTMQLV